MPPSLNDPLPDGALTELEWAAELGGKSRWSLLEPSMRSGIERVTVGSSKESLIKSFKSHLSAREGQIGMAQSSWTEVSLTPEWTGNLRVRARLDCLRALMWESSEEAFAAAEGLAAELGQAPISKKRSWDPLPAEGSLACAYAVELARELSKAPQRGEQTLALSARWIDRLSAWGVSEWRSPALAALSCARGGGKAKRPSADAVRLIVKGACQMIRRIGPEPQVDLAAPAPEMDLGLKLAELALSAYNEQGVSHGELNQESAGLVEEAWAMAAQSAPLGAPSDSWLSRMLLSIRRSEQDAGLSLALAREGERLGALPSGVFKRMASRPFEELAPVFGNPVPGLGLWISALLEEGMDPNGLNDKGQSLLCLANESAKSRPGDAARAHELSLCAAALLRGGANPAFIVPQLDPLESAHPAFKGLIAAAAERAQLDQAARSPAGERALRSGL